MKAKLGLSSWTSLKHSTFDTLSHKPLIAKSKVYGLDSESSSFLQSYLTERYWYLTTLE